MSAPEREEEAGLEPAAAPLTGAEPFRLGAEPPKVVRLSRKALAILGGASGIAIGGALLYALHPTEPKVAENLYDSDRPNKSELVTGAPGDYGKIPKLGEPLPSDLGRPILAARENGETVPVPPIGSAPAPDPRIAAAEEARQRELQEREAAKGSRLFLGSGSGAASGSGLVEIPTPDSGAARELTSNIEGRKEFMAVGSQRATGNSERIVSPSSARVVQAGTVIPAALITGIRSDLPGQIIAQVTQNVYDSPTGRILLIPQGARLVGEYDSEVAAGQRRVLLAWDRLILPGGRSIRLERQPGADASGHAGLEDQVNNHWGRMVRAALISSLLGIGTEVAASGDSETIRALRSGLQDSTNEAGRRLVERELSVSPTLTIRPGFAFRVIVTRDLVFEENGERR